MTITEALTAARDRGMRVRPVIWRQWQSLDWIEYGRGHFIERGEMQEIPHALRLSREEEFLGEWEEYQ